MTSFFEIPFVGELLKKVVAEPQLGWGLLLFIVAIVHTFSATAVRSFASKLGENNRFLGRALVLFGEVEFVFILWAVPLFWMLSLYKGFDGAVEYMGTQVNYREAVFVFVIVALAATRPIIYLGKRILGGIARLLGGGVIGWWYSLLIIGPLLGSLITEVAAITITALLLATYFYKAKPTRAFAYATLALLFVNISIGGVLTHFGAPAVVMVADRWGMDTPYMFTHFGWRAAVAIVINVSLVGFLFRKQLKAMQLPETTPESKIPWWVITVHLLLLVWAVLTAHSAPLFIFGLLAAGWFVGVTREYQEAIRLIEPFKVGIFLAGLIIFCGMQTWWITPLLQSIGPGDLFGLAMFLASFNDNAAVTYLVSTAPNLSEAMKFAALTGAVVGGGLTLIANAPNPAGFALVRKYFTDETLNARMLFLSAVIPTVVAGLVFFL